MIKKIFLGALVIILAKCSPNTGIFTLSGGPAASLSSNISGRGNSGQTTTLTGNAAINSANSISNAGSFNSASMTSNIAGNAFTAVPINVNTGTIRNRNIR